MVTAIRVKETRCVLGMAIIIGKVQHRHGLDFTPPFFLHQEPSGRLNDKWQTGLKQPGLGHNFSEQN